MTGGHIRISGNKLVCGVMHLLHCLTWQGVVGSQQKYMPLKNVQAENKIG